MTSNLEDNIQKSLQIFGFYQKKSKWARDLKPKHLYKGCSRAHSTHIKSFEPEELKEVLGVFSAKFEGDLRRSKRRSRRSLPVLLKILLFDSRSSCEALELTLLEQDSKLEGDQAEDSTPNFIQIQVQIQVQVQEDLGV